MMGKQHSLSFFKEGSDDEFLRPFQKKGAKDLLRKMLSAIIKIDIERGLRTMTFYKEIDAEFFIPDSDKFHLLPEKIQHQFNLIEEKSRAPHYLLSKIDFISSFIEAVAEVDNVFFEERQIAPLGHFKYVASSG